MSATERSVLPCAVPCICPGLLNLIGLIHFRKALNLSSQRVQVKTINKVLKGGLRLRRLSSIAKCFIIIDVIMMHCIPEKLQLRVVAAPKYRKNIKRNAQKQVWQQ